MSSKLPPQLVKLARKSRRMPNPIALPAHNKGPEFGRQIFVYNHLQTNQVVYSLTENLNNNAALKQIPYNGKKTKPAALRKDLWAPLATIEFPPSIPDSGAHGLDTFQKLREYRKLHETLWPESLAREEYKGDDKDKKGEMVTLTRKERGRRLCDQKANSVADMAAALKLTTMRKLSQEEVAVERRARRARAAEREKAKEEGRLAKDAEEVDEGELKTWEPIMNAKIKWTDILDAEFAESWPETVVHDQWVTGRMGRPLPSPRFNYVQVREPAPVVAEGDTPPHSA